MYLLSFTDVGGTNQINYFLNYVKNQTNVLGKPSNEKNGNSLVFYQTGGGRYPKIKLFPFLSC